MYKKGGKPNHFSKKEKGEAFFQRGGVHEMVLVLDSLYASIG